MLRLCGTPLGARTGRQIRGMTSSVGIPRTKFASRMRFDDLYGRMFAAAAKVRARVCKSCLGDLIDDASHVLDNLNHTRYRETPA